MRNPAILLAILLMMPPLLGAADLSRWEDDFSDPAKLLQEMGVETSKFGTSNNETLAGLSM